MESKISSWQNVFEKKGAIKVAHFTKYGYKLGRWYDMIWMEK